MTLTLATVLSLAATCQSAVAPVTIAKIAHVESRFDPTLVHTNADRSIDVGLMQINSKNFKWLGLTMRDALDPCKSIRAGAELLASFSRYNTGSPTRGIANGYALAVQGTKHEEKGMPAPPPDPGPIYLRPSRSRRTLVYNGE